MFESKMAKIEKAVGKGDEKTLIKLAGGKEMEHRLQAIAGLGKTKGDDGFNYLILLLRNQDAVIRTAAAKALGETGNPHAKAHIKAQYKVETDTQAREALSNAAAKIKEF